jgi:hypothetical protein
MWARNRAQPWVTKSTGSKKLAATRTDCLASRQITFKCPTTTSTLSSEKSLVPDSVDAKEDLDLPCGQRVVALNCLLYIYVPSAALTPAPLDVDTKHDQSSPCLRM